MDVKWLNTFVALAAQHNYLRVAEQLNFAPSTLARHIQLLEEELGIKLFQKNGKQVVLTNEGELYLSYARKLIAVQQEAAFALSYATELKGEISVAGCDTNVYHLFVPFMVSLSNQYPQVRFSTYASSNARVLYWLREKDVDLGFMYSLEKMVSGTVEVIPLFKEQASVITAPTNPLATKNEVYFSDLRNQHFSYAHETCCFMGEFRRRLDEAGIEPLSTTFHGNVSAMLGSAIQNNGIALLPCSCADEIIKNKAVALNWKEKPIEMWTNLVYLKGKWLTPALREMISDCKRYVKELVDNDFSGRLFLP